MSMDAAKAAWRAGACAVRGGSHAQRNIPCQDAAMACCREDRVFAAVADGHGHAAHVRSADGARLACEAAYAVLSGACLRELTDEAVRAMAGEILLRWEEAVMADVRRRPFAQEELEAMPQEAREACAAGQGVLRAYGTTLCAAVAGDEMCLVLRCGDGECVLLRGDGTYVCPVPEHPACSGNVTVSLCEGEAGAFRWHIGERPAAVFLTTDGLTNNALRRSGLMQWADRLLLACAGDGADGMLRLVRRDLESVAARGFGDDVSLAFALDAHRACALEETVRERVRRCRQARAAAQRKKRIAVLEADILWAQRAVQRRREEYAQAACGEAQTRERLLEGIGEAERLLRESSMALARLTGQEAGEKPQDTKADDGRNGHAAGN